MIILSALFLVSLVSSSPVNVEQNDYHNNVGLSRNASESDILIYYYSRKYSEILIKHENFRGSLASTDFDEEKVTIIGIHGWQNDYNSEFSQEIRTSYLQVEDVNVFIIDWNRIASEAYADARTAVPTVATLLAKLIDSLIKYEKLDLSKVILVGHSLGAHVAGLTGAALKGQVNTIVGLDPAGPQFDKDKLHERLDASDGKFVQAVHTSPGMLGVNFNVGHADYYANNGPSQPGCQMDWTGACAHGRSFLYFAESVRTGNFKAYQCDNYKSFKSGLCINHQTSNMGGSSIDRSASGTYYFETNSSPPFAKL